MAAIDDWKSYFDLVGIGHWPVDSNPNAVQLINLAGTPIFRGVDSTIELNELHTKARQKSSEMKRLLVLGLPFSNPQTITTLPGNIVLPRCRVYGGHIGDTFSTTGHLIESEFLRNIKKEVLMVMSHGTKVKTPLCSWAIKLLKTNWVYGTPSSLAQLDTLLGLLITEVNSIGHVRSRQLSFGRGCGDAMLLPRPGLVLPNNSLDQVIESQDFRFIGLEAEIKHYNSARTRIHPTMSDKYLQVLSKQEAIDAGAHTSIGASVLGKRKVKVVA